ncbi:MAG TPA: HAD hydrolase family protein [Anaerolineaceae bacterium]|nr:HAD hydrolase family protein [Anaerolineaceae bacterium]
MVAGVLAVIPARGGSKGIPRKNLRGFLGHPLIAYSIAAARQAQSVTRVIVSTDDEEISAVAREYGAETPFLRPAEFAQDQTTDLPVFVHALTWLQEHEGYCPEIVVQLRPTSPVRPRDLVDRAVALLRENPEADSVRGVVPAGQNPYKMWLIEDRVMRPLLSVEGIAEPYNAPRQNLPPVYWQTGHIDAIRPRTILEQGSMSGTVILPLMIDPRYTVDIDKLADLERAEKNLRQEPLEMVTPGKLPRPLPEQIELIVFDFDGVMTDDRVWVDETGREQVAANRSDGYGLELLRRATGIRALVLSKETNPVVTARCKKIKVPVLQGINDKATALSSYLAEEKIDPARAVYVGNDINDLPCFPLVACAVAVADAHLNVLSQADLVLTRKGGHGAVRELCDLIMQKMTERSA